MNTLNMLTREQMKGVKGGFVKARCTLFINHGSYYTETAFDCLDAETCDVEGDLTCQETGGCTGYSCDGAV